MKLISLNTWGGRAGFAGLKDFFTKYREVDIFCLQEIWQTQSTSLEDVSDPRIVKNLLEEIAACLPDHRFYFRPQFRGIYGLATFIRRDHTVVDEGELFVFKEQGFENPLAMGNHARNIQHLTLQRPRGFLTVINFHGLWNGQGKSDSPDRLLQSRKIADFARTLRHPVLLLGDFNLRPDTQSFKILTEAFPQDLISIHGVQSTRSSFYEKPEKFADYVMATSELKIPYFKVLPYEVSDHLALAATLGDI